MPDDPKTPRWTLPQRTAIDHVFGDLLVSAAAGSGKTAVLAERCARLVCEEIDGGCGVEGLLVLTFTEAAANEMRARVARAIRDKFLSAKNVSARRANWLRRQEAMVERASISTLHAFCARVLRQHFSGARIDPSFELMDEDEARLIREEVLDDLFARWHALPPTDKQAIDFSDFFEAYAQGRDANCREIVLRVHSMLASTADPEKYLADTRANYRDDGCAATVERFITDVIGGQLRLLELSAARACSEVAAHAGAGSAMFAEMKKSAQMIAWARAELETKGSAALDAIRTGLSYKWPICKTLKDVPDFESLKKRTWERLKDALKGFCANALASDPALMRADMANLARPIDTLLALVADFDNAFTAAKRARNRLDFSDLERLTLDLLQRPDSAALRDLQQRYHHLLVDEFQDINPLQAALLDALRSPTRFEGRGNLFVVGDVKQSIYGFRLAEPELFLQRERHARLALQAGGQGFIALPHNFRSQPKLLAAMNNIFERILTLELAGITYADGHALEPAPSAESPQTIANCFDGAPVELHIVVMERDEEDEPASEDSPAPETPAENLTGTEEEARVVAKRIRSLIDERRHIRLKDGSSRPLEYRDIAILLRAMKNKAMIFARVLALEGIPLHADLSAGYFDTTEVRDTLALLHVLDNPQQDIALATVLLGPYGRFSHDDLAKIRLTFDRKTIPFADAVHRYPLPQTSADAPPFDEDLATRLTHLFSQLARWREKIRMRPLHEGLAEIYSESKILPYLAGLDAGSQRVANLEALHQRALKFSGFSKQGLHRFLRFIEKLRDQDGDFGEASVLSEASNVVRILSVHKSKGLEFPVVFVSGLGGLLNLRDSGPVQVHRDLGVGLQVADVERNIFYPSAASACIAEAKKRSARAEELRLLYVAMTRARDHLVLTGHVAKHDTLHEVRAAWHGHDSPLPEDVLLKGRTFFDWLLPAIACNSQARWNPTVAQAPAELEVTVHAALGSPVAHPSNEPSAGTDFLRSLTTAQALPAGPVDSRVDRLIARVTGAYAFETLARQPAVQTVSELKSRESDEDPAAPIVFIDRAIERAAPSSDDAKRRGIATHRLLELIDFAKCASESAITAQINELIVQKKIDPIEAVLVDLPAIVWLFTNTPAGARAIAAVKTATANLQSPIHVRREIPFTWSAPPLGRNPSNDPADWPTIRGTIDLLIADTAAKTAEIVDYKTDSSATWQSHLPAYERQMQYYLRAASDILGFPVQRATLIFLGPKTSHEVALKVTLTAQSDG